MAEPTADPRGHGPAERVVDHSLLGPLPPAGTVQFDFEGRTIRARAGEPVIAALLAGGVKVLRTMPSSGEPRGGYCLVGRCSDCLVVIDGTPNQRACLVPVARGSRVEVQRGLGSWSAHSTPVVPGDAV